MSNENKQNRIAWMMDETIADAHPADWPRVRKLESSLIGSIGKPNFSHELVDPMPCFREVTKQLQHEQFSAVLDLTGWLTPAMQELFPDTHIENRFSLSRVRVVSSPKLETTGYKVSLFPEQIEMLRTTVDLSRPLIIDDVSFSGWTSRKTMDILDIDPEVTTHAFLIANTGDVGKDPGAVPILESMGGRVVFGHELKAPQDDGWHLRDLYQNPHFEQAFALSLQFQELVRRDGQDSDLAQNFFTHEAAVQIVFPDNLTSVQIRELVREGRFILQNGSVIDGDEIHARNPFLWATPYFQQHVDLDEILANKDEVVAILGEIRSLTTNPEGKKEARLEFQREVRRVRGR